MEIFLGVLFFVGIIAASLTDLKRREIDNWLTSLLLFSGTAYVFFKIFSQREFSQIADYIYLIIAMYILMNALYYGRVFAGGDAKLLFSMTPLFFTGSFYRSLENAGIFVFCLMLFGSVYGIIYSGILYLKKRKEVNSKLFVRFAELKLGKKIVIGFLVGLILLYFYSKILFFIGGFSLLMGFLFVFAQCLEGVVMVNGVKGKDLTEGDWLVKDVKVGKKVIKASWDGLSKEEVALLSKTSKVYIKGGIPFGPAFLGGIIGYVFLREDFLEIFFRLGFLF